MATVTSSKRQQTHTSNTYESNSTVTVGTNVIMNTSCTVDGRDVSADGTKLDGIACGATSCTGTGVGNITCITTNTGLDGSGSSGTVNITMDLTEITLGAGIDSTATGLSLDLSEFTDMTGGIDTAVDELILLDNGAERRKLFSEIFGCNAYSSTAFTTCLGDITAVTAGSGLTGGATTGGATLNVGAGTAITVAADTVSVNSTCNSTWNAKTTCTGTVTSIATGTGLDGTFTTSGTITLDLSELTDMTGGIDTAVDEIILLDNGAERRKRFAEIFGSNAYNSTTIPTNNNQLTNGSGYTTCTGTTTPSNTQTFTNKSGNISQWTNNSGYTTCTGCISNINVGAGIETGSLGGGDWCLTLNFSNLTDGTAAIVPTSDEIVYLDAGSQKRKLFSEIFGCNAYSNTAFTTCTGTTTPSNSQTFTNKGGNISQWTNDCGYTQCTGNVVTSGSTFTGNVTFNDSVCLRIGSSADLSLFHNGNHSYIDNNKNSLYIRNNVDGDDGGDIYIMPHDNENGIIVHDDSRVDIYNDNALKFCTQSYGTRTTGTVCASYDVRAPYICGTSCVNGGEAKFSTTGVGDQNAQNYWGLVAGDKAGCVCGCVTGGSILACGNVNICGTLAKASGCFDITHPLPALSATKRLSHSFVESPQADNIYSGVVQLTGGSATVNIDAIHGMTSGTLTALNRCFRTFTTNETNWDPVRGSVTDNTLTIESCVADSTATVSWMVLGERHDPHMLANEHTDNEGRARVEYTPPTDIHSEGKWVSV